MCVKLNPLPQMFITFWLVNLPNLIGNAVLQQSKPWVMLNKRSVAEGKAEHRSQYPLWHFERRILPSGLYDVILVFLTPDDANIVSAFMSSPNVFSHRTPSHFYSILLNRHSLLTCWNIYGSERESIIKNHHTSESKSMSRTILSLIELKRLCLWINWKTSLCLSVR